MHFLVGHCTENVDFWRVTLVLYLCMWLLSSSDMDIVYVHLATDMECGFIAEDETFYEIIFLHFHLHLLTKVTPFQFVCWCKGLHQSHLVGLKHSRLRNTFHTVIFGMSNSLLALATDLWELRRNASCTLSMFHQTHEVDQDSCLYTSIQFPQTVGTT